MDDPRLAELRREREAVRQVLARGPGCAHLLGIGGVGMAAVAVQLQARGYEVTGCDTRPGSVARWLEARGLPVRQGHAAGHLTGRERMVVRSPAVAAGEPECERARQLGLPLFLRGTLLPALLEGQRSIAVGGTHGKTTTTAMLVHMLRALSVDVSFCIGGEADHLGGVAGVGRSGLVVVEADESDGTLALYAPTYGVITNVELDHADYFRNEAELAGCFGAFAGQAAEAVVYGADDAGATRAAEQARRRLSFGFAEHADVQARQVRPEGGGIAGEVWSGGAALGTLSLPVPGRTNLLDALAAVTVGLDLGYPFARLAAGLRDFRSVRRRFEVMGEGRGITVISDYAHHPTEVRALFEQARSLGPRRLLAVFQPHRYTRTAALGAAFPPAFAGAAEVVLAPVYAASEPPVPGGRSEDLHAHFARAGGAPAHLTHSLLEAWEHIRNTWREGDVLLVVGAGDVEKIAAWAVQELGVRGVSRS